MSAIVREDVHVYEKTFTSCQSPSPRVRPVTKHFVSFRKFHEGTPL